MRREAGANHGRARVLPLFAELTLEHLSDPALLAACALGDGRALGALYSRHQGAVYRFLSRLVGMNDPALDDLVQTSFIEAWKSAPGFSGRSSVGTWLFGIAANLARHHHRAQARRRTVLSLLSSGDPPRSHDPEAAVSNRQFVEHLGHALDSLPQDLRVAYVMCELEEIPGVEAARVLGVREGTMWRRLHQARRRLASLLEEER